MIDFASLAEDLVRGTGRGAALLLFTLALGAGPVRAAGLGEIELLSRLGEPLRAAVGLTGANAAALDPGCLRLTEGRGTEDLPTIRRARLTIDDGPQGTRVMVSTVDPVPHPVVVLAIRMACEAELTRQYVLLMPAPDALRLPRLGPGQATPEREARIPQTPARTARRPADGRWQIAEGDTLASIAAQLYPRSRSRQRHFIEAAAASNPQLVSAPQSPATASLPAGSELVLPTARPTPPAADHAPDPLSAQHAQSARRAAPALTDRLSIAGGGEHAPLKLATVLGQRGNGRGTSEAQRELLRTEQRLLQALEEKIVEQLTLADKIRRMETVVADMQASLTQLEASIRANRVESASAQRPAAPVSTAVAAPAPATPSVSGASAEPAKPSAQSRSAPPPEAPRELWRDWLLGIGLLAATALLVAILRRRRREAQAEHAEAFATEFEAPVDETALVTPEEEYEETVRFHRPLIEAAAGAPAATEDLDTMAQPLPVQAADIDVSETDSAMELAEIMLSFGRVKGAAQTLADFIKTNPKQAVEPWLKLLDVYRGAGMRTEWESLAGQLNQTFNVEVVQWDGDSRSPAPLSLEDYPHIMARLTATWPTQQAIDFLNQLLKDNRNGTRSGFPLPVLGEILSLISVLEAERPAPSPELQLEDLPQRAVG